MRIRSVVAMVSLLLPAALSAQRIPLPRIGPRPNPGRELPPQPTPIANDLAYRRWRLSVESYPVVSLIQTNTASWAAIGAGTRADYLLNRNVSATLDLTSTILGGPAIVSSAELGTRIHPEWAEHRLFPYVDLRVGYLATYDRQLATIGDRYAYGYTDPVAGYGQWYSRGFGATGGAGVEYSLNRWWSIMTGAALVSAQMTSHEINASDRHFGMTVFRYMLGVRYNPVRVIRYPGTDTR